MADRTFNDVKINLTLKPQATRANLSSSKEDLAVQMGKIQKWYPGLNNYATCATAAGTAIKTVDCPGFELTTGTVVIVKFTVTNTAAVADLQLNVNGTGAKGIKYRNANLSAASVLTANRIYAMLYDGTYWQIIGDLDTNSNTYDRTSVQTRIYAGAKGVFPYSLCAMDTVQRMQAFTTTGGTGTSKAFNSSEKFLYPPVIMYHSANSTISNGSVIANNVLYEQYPSVDMKYSANVTTSVAYSQYKPLYIECTFDSNGYWSPTGITQTFTSGKYYILLGCMYNTSIYQLALFAQHPLYYYNGTNLINGELHLQDGRYLPMAGGTMDNAAEVTIPNGSHSSKYTGFGMYHYIGAGNGWARGINVNSTDDTRIGSLGMYGTANSTEPTYAYFGKTYDDAWYQLYKSIFRINDDEENGFQFKYKPSSLSSGYGASFITLFPGDTYGYGIVIGHTHGGLTVVGGGESASGFTNTAFDSTTSPYGSTVFQFDSEELVLTADNSIWFVSGANGLSTSAHTDWTNLKTALFDSSGNFRPSVDNKGSIGTSSYKWASIHGTTIYENGASLASKYAAIGHTHDSLTSKVLTKSTLDGTAGNFFFKGDNLLGDVNDWVGIQADAGNDKFQMIASSNSLLYRQNDTGGTNSTNWREWVGLLAPDRVTTDTYLSAEATTSTLGTGTTAFTYNSGVKISHKAYTAYSSGLYKITVDAAGHVSAATALTITPTPSSKTHTNWDTTAERAYLVTKGWMSYWNGAYNSRNGSNLTYCNRGAFGTIVTKSDTDYVPFKTVTGTPDMNDYMDEDGWIKWNTNAGTNVPTGNWGILLTKALPNIQVFIPDNATGIYFRRKANATSDPTEWWGLTGSAGNTYDLNNLKYAFVYDSTSDFASYAWHKFAEVTVTDANADATATFLVSKTWGNTPLVTGILSAHIRTDSTKVFNSAQFRWMITNGEGGINPNEFVMVYTNTASKSCKVELWHKQTAQYDGWVFKLLKEHSRVSYSQYPWTLFEQNGHGSATYTAGTGEIVSTLNSIANPALSADKINTDAGDFQTPVYFSDGVPVEVNIAAPSAYFGTVPRVRQSDGVMAIGRYIDFHATNASTNNYDVRLDASSTNMVTMNSASGSTTLRIAGTLPMLRFQQTTSGKAYDNTSCGIWCRPADTNGVNMFMQSGGCIMIGAGEFASGAYSRKDSTGTTQTGYDNIANSTAERLYLGADGEVHIISNGQNIATYSNNDHRVWKFNTSGQLITPGFIADTLDLQHTMLQQNLRSAPNCVTLAEWIVNGAASTTYKPGISFYNMGGDSTDKGAIILRPYHHNTDPWASGHPVGLYIGKNMLSLDGVNVALQNATSLNTMINALGTGSSAPVDADYYVSQYAGGGTTTTTYHRRPVSALYSYIRSKHIKSAIAVQTGSSKKAKITLQTLMTWLITTKKYIPSGTTEDIIIKTTWAYANNDILRFNANGVDYEMSLAGVIIEFKGLATSYNTGEFTFTITSAPAVLSDAPTSGYTRFPANTTAVYHCNGSSYNPTWTVNMNKAVQTLLYSSTSSAGYGYVDIVIGSVFSIWSVLLLEFMEASYGYSNENPHSGSGLIPLSLVRSLGNVSDISKQYQIPIGYNPGNTTANQYISVVYTDESTFRLSRGGSGGPIGKLKIYGIC